MAPPLRSSLWHSSWPTSAIFGGLAFILVYQLGSVFLPITESGLAAVLLRMGLGLVPFLFFLVFPFITRRQTAPAEPGSAQGVSIIREVLVSIPVIAACVIVIFLGDLVFSYFYPGQHLDPREDRLSRLASWNELSLLLPFMVLTVLVAPITEEVFFRGFLFNAFRTRMQFSIALVLQSFVFGLAHWISPWHSMGAAVLGLFLGLCYWWRKTLLAPIVVHAGCNAFALAGALIASQHFGDGPVLGVTPGRTAEPCVVESVAPGSPAEQAGLLPGDTILQVDGLEIEGFQDLVDAVSEYEPGDTVTLLVTRQDATLEMTAVLTSRRELANKPEAKAAE